MIKSTNNLSDLLTISFYFSFVRFESSNISKFIKIEIQVLQTTGPL